MAGTKVLVEQALANNSPLLHHLNADSSWLLQIPRPVEDQSSGGRCWFNILIDPWLSGAQSDVASWFSTQKHAVTPCYESVKAVELLARENEDIAAAYYASGPSTDETLIDAIAISHEYTDHCHKQTLLQVRPSVPVFASTQAAKIIRSWDHFELVTEPTHFSSKSRDWTQLSRLPLPKWISIARVVTEGDAQYYHSALLITFQNKDSKRSIAAEAIIYTPHGIKAEDLEIVAKAEPRIHTLALLHGLHKISLVKKQLNLGAYNGLQAQRLLNARHWIGTHDEVKKGTGVVAWFLGRKALTVGDAMQEEQRRTHNSKTDTASSDDIKFTDLANGQCVVLD